MTRRFSKLFIGLLLLLQATAVCSADSDDAGLLESWEEHYRRNESLIPKELKQLRERVTLNHVVPVETALAEMQRLQRALWERERPEGADRGRLLSPGRASRMFATYTDLDPYTLPHFSGEPHGGPLGEINLSNGELIMTSSDLSLPARGGLAFAFRRTFRSYRQYAGPLGQGWDHNHAQRLVFDKTNAGDANKAVWYTGRDNISFERRGRTWEPQPGIFCSLVLKGREAIIRSREGLRLVFERAETRSAASSFWRIAKVTTLHRDGRKYANQMVYEYQPGCDRLRSVTDPFGNEIAFGYDETGRLAGLVSGRHRVTYSYDSADCLAKVTHRAVALSFNEVTDVHELYGYSGDEGGTTRLVSYKPFGQQVEYRYRYDDPGREKSARLYQIDEMQVAGGAIAEWRIVYEAQGASRTTVYRPPAPSPERHFFFGGQSETARPKTVTNRLPLKMVMPGRNAMWHYTYNSDGLALQTTHPSGRQTVWVYQSDHADPTMRANQIATRELPSPGPSPLEIKEFGIERTFHESLPLPIRVQQYEISSSGAEHVLETSEFKYDYAGDLIFQRTGEMPSWFVRNAYGEVALEIDGTGVVDAWYRFDRFIDGRAALNGGGLVAKEIRDIPRIQWLTDSRRAKLSLPGNMPQRALSASPVARSLEFAYSPAGHLAAETHEQFRRLFIANKLGQVLCGYDTRRDLEVEFLDEGLRVVRRAHRITPVAVGYAYKGEELPGLSGRFVVQQLDRDARGLLTRWTKTSESFAGAQPKVLYVRSPNGSVSRREARGEPALVFKTDNTTGFETGRFAEADGQRLPLRTEMKYDAEGNLVSYLDDLGESHSNRLDRFGRPFSTVAPNGVITENWMDGAGRVTRMRVIDKQGRVLDESSTEYGKAAQLLTANRHRLAYDDAGKRSIDEWLVKEAYTYDAAGRQITQRSFHNKSTVSLSYDGLDRVVKRRMPEGDSSTTVYAGDNPVISINRLKHTGNGDVMAVATMTYFDEHCRPWLTVPCAGDGTPAFDRATVMRADSQGRQVLRARPGGAIMATAYNSLDASVFSSKAPSDQASEVEIIVTRSSFDVAGRKLLAEMENHPLALIYLTTSGKTNTLVAERVGVPRIRRFQYDRFGRLETDVNPDGLTTKRTYGKGSMVASLTRSRQGEKAVMRFEYDSMRRLVRLSDDNRSLQVFQYDAAGNLLRSTDHANPHFTVRVETSYDSLGAVLTERSDVPECDNEGLPTLYWNYDLQDGVATLGMKGVSDKRGYWHKQVSHLDGQNRVRRISLDKEQSFASFEYIGTQQVFRRIPESGLAKITSVTPLLDVSHEEWRDEGNANTSPQFRFRYFYDSHGRIEAHDLNVPSHKVAATHLHGHDPYQRLVRQGVVHRTFDNREARMRALEARVGEYLEALRIAHLDYDEAGNRFREYRLGASARPGRDFTPPEDMSSVLYYSPSLPFSSEDLEAGKEQARHAPDMASDRVGAVAKPHGVKREYHYDPFGRLTKFSSDRGGKKLNWSIDYDPLGRPWRMIARDGKTSNTVEILEFATDVHNRRVLKKVSVVSGAPPDSPKRQTRAFQRTVYEGMRPVWVADLLEPEASEQYLWGAGYREVLLAVLPRNRVEPDARADHRRYFLHQNKNLNVFASTAVAEGQIETFDIADYLGFGESATYARIRRIRAHGLDRETGYQDGDSYDQLLSTKTQWNPDSVNSSKRGLLIDLGDAACLEQLTIWPDQFPKSFRVLVLPPDAHYASRNMGAIVAEFWSKRPGDEVLAARVEGGRIVSRGPSPARGENPYEPYRIDLGRRTGHSILILWDEPTTAQVREFEVRTVPPSSSSLAFSAAWRDEETGLLYQGARYRLPEMAGKFICPDPFGFAAGHNLYAYAHNSPLVYYDPDGEWVHIAAGAGFGAAFGAGAYGLQVWLTDEEWDWAKFAIYTGAGALSGAAGAATFGASLAWTSGAGLTATQSGIIGSTLAGAAGGTTHGLVSSGGIAYYETGDLALATRQGAKGALISGGLGAVGGAAGGAVLSKVGASFWGATASGAAGGAAAGGVHEGIQGAIETRTWSGTMRGALLGTARGAATGGAIGAAGWGVGRAGGLFRKLPDQPDIVDKKGLLVKTKRPASEDVSYGNEPVKPGFARHHKKPLSLGGADTAENLEYVPLGKHRQNHPVGVQNDPYGTLYSY